MPRALILAGGIYHPFAETSAVLTRLLGALGIEAETTFDIEAGLRGVGERGYDLLVVNCLRWSMTQHEKYEPFRAEFQFSPSLQARAALERHLGGGGGLLGLHTASICFDDWPEWRDLLGAAWVWGRSHHPPLGPIETHVTDTGHAVSREVAPFTVQDEIYSELDLAPHVRVLAEGRTAGEGSWQPVAMAMDGPGGRRCYLALGHDAASLADPAHARLVTQALRWTARAPALVTEAAA